jgi:hypothetical protein
MLEHMQEAWFEQAGLFGLETIRRRGGRAMASMKGPAGRQQRLIRS